MPLLLRSQKRNATRRAVPKDAVRQVVSKVDEPEKLIRKSRRQASKVHPNKAGSELSDPDKLWKKPRGKDPKTIAKYSQARQREEHAPANDPRDQYAADDHQSSARRGPNRSSVSAAKQSTRSVATWLHEIRGKAQRSHQMPATPPRFQALVDDLEDEMDDDDVSPSESMYWTSNATNRARKLLNKLEKCGIAQFPDPRSEDPRLAWFKETMVKDVVKNPSKDTIQHVIGAVKEFLGQVEEADQLEEGSRPPFFELVNNLYLEVDRAKSDMGFPVIQPLYFESMRTKCVQENEAVLQRSMMMSAFHQHYLPDLFSWNAEQYWIPPPPQKDFDLPYDSSPNSDNSSNNNEESERSTEKTDSSTRKKNKKKAKEESRRKGQPKPDLTISFNSVKFEESVFEWPRRSDYAQCASPEGTRRSFPFLIVEVKKSRAVLETAELQNLWTAGRALLNIYHWMKKARLESEFYDQVRVFSFAFNAQTLTVRVHRGVRSRNRFPKFQYDILKDEEFYNWDTIPKIIDNILREYASKMLWDTLRKTARKLYGVPPDEVPARNGTQQMYRDDGQPDDEDPDEGDVVQDPDNAEQEASSEDSQSTVRAPQAKRPTNDTQAGPRKAQKEGSAARVEAIAPKGTRQSERLAAKNLRDSFGASQLDLQEGNIPP